MAIVNIYGFQNYADYTDVEWNYQFTPFGKLPFWNSHYRYDADNSRASGFRFTEFQGRVWLRSVPGGYHTANYYATNAVRSVSFNVPVNVVFGGYVNDVDVTRFVFGCRWWFPDGDKRPSHLVSLDAEGGNVHTRGLQLLNRGEVPAVDNVIFYTEFEFDLSLGVVKRWVDGVRLVDVALPSSWTSKETFQPLFLHFGNKVLSGNGNHGAYTWHFGLNDFYFIADTSHLNDGLPSSRLGPIEVEALPPKTVTLPSTWANTTGEDPVHALSETIDTVDVRDRPALVSDSEGDRAIVGFDAPEVQEGEILYCELEAYAYREYGDAVALNTQVTQGSQSAPEQQHALEPERLRTQENTIQPAKLHKPLDGDTWDESKLGQITLALWSSKPE